MIIKILLKFTPINKYLRIVYYLPINNTFLTFIHITQAVYLNISNFYNTHTFSFFVNTRTIKYLF